MEQMNMPKKVNTTLVDRTDTILQTEGCMEVDTPLGKLCASTNRDPDYPEIYIYLKRQDDVEIDLVAVSVDIESETVKAYLYGDTSVDSWTKKHTWNSSEINIPIEE